MGILNENLNTLRLFVKANRDKDLQNSDSIFTSMDKRSSNTFTHGNIDIGNGEKTSLFVCVSFNGTNFEFIEEPKNVVAIGIPVKDVKIFGIETISITGGVGNKFDNEELAKRIKIIPRLDKKSINKSDTHLIFWRFKFNKDTIEYYYDTRANGSKSYGTILSGVSFILDFAHNYRIPQNKYFPYKKFVDVMLDNTVLL